MKKFKKPLPSILRGIGITIILLILTNVQSMEKTEQKNIKMHNKSKNIVQKEQQPVIEQPQEEIQQETVEQPTSYETRMTSYYPEEGENITASGLTPNDFEINENGWFTYQGKLVVATASTRLGYTEMRTYNLYDELTLNIDGIDYKAIVLDVCGACQRLNRIDLFVSSYIYAKDTMVEVK